MVEECFKCGITDNKIRLFDAISGEGIKKICERCSMGENIPIIRRPTTFQLKEAERKQSVYEKLSGAAGVNPIKHKQRLSVDEERKRRLLEKQDTTLRDVVDRNYKIRQPINIQPRADLIENFHWILMRSRRKKKLTQSDLAREISESVNAIKMAEQGILPEDDHKLLNKLEAFLGIRLSKNKFPPEKLGLPEESTSIVTKEDFEKGVKFDPLTAKTITISDLQEMKKQDSELAFDNKELKKERFWKRTFGKKSKIEKEEEIGEIDLDELEVPESRKEDFSDEEMGNLIFRK